MVEFQIQYFRAAYDERNKIGWLCGYYPYDAVKTRAMDPDEWRETTYSPEILNFKEGLDQNIRYFVPPVVQLIQNICRHEKLGDGILLVPMPSSLPKNHPDYKTTPRAKGETRNRDDRNEIFCKMMAAAQSNWQSLPFLSRIKDKAPKEHWTADQHFASLAVDASFAPILSQMPCFLVDDVTTTHASFMGARKCLLKASPSCRAFCVAIGHSTAP